MPLYENKFARVSLRIEREVPSVLSVPKLLIAAGMNEDVQEHLCVVTVDSVYNVRHIIEIARGGYHEMQVSIPAILSAVLLSGTDRFQIVHNHPSANLSPTVADVNLTNKVMEAANACGLYFEDHVILGPDGNTFSMADEGMITESPDIARMARINKPVRRRKSA